MDYAYEIRRQAEAAPRAALPAVAVRAVEGVRRRAPVTEAEAEALSGLIEARQMSKAPPLASTVSEPNRNS